jgi:hypothetical protein
MALFKVNTGLREQEVVNLRWQWESPIPELGPSIFVIPRDYVKNRLDRYVVLNRIARSVIASCRGRHCEFVFTYKGSPVTRIYNSGRKAARRRAAARYEFELGRPCPTGFRAIRVHDMKHTYGHRLRVAGVSDQAPLIRRISRIHQLLEQCLRLLMILLDLNNDQSCLHSDLNLRSSNRRNDALLIFVVFIIESVFELAVFDKNVFRLTTHQALIGAPLTFAVYFLGTVLPTMVLIYAILLPRYLKLTGSTVSAVLLGGLT